MHIWERTMKYSEHSVSLSLHSLLHPTESSSHLSLGLRPERWRPCRWSERGLRPAETAHPAGQPAAASPPVGLGPSGTFSPHGGTVKSRKVLDSASGSSVNSQPCREGKSENIELDGRIFGVYCEQEMENDFSCSHLSTEITRGQVPWSCFCDGAVLLYSLEVFHRKVSVPWRLTGSTRQSITILFNGPKFRVSSETQAKLIYMAL